MHRLPLFGKSRNFFKWINFGVIDQNGEKERERKERKTFRKWIKFYKYSV